MKFCFIALRPCMRTEILFNGIPDMQAHGEI
jgi:hypothetical protein